eukprot:517583-Ditylum_brightwellii.AAC.1
MSCPSAIADTLEIVASGSAAGDKHNSPTQCDWESIEWCFGASVPRLLQCSNLNLPSNPAHHLCSPCDPYPLKLEWRFLRGNHL